MVTVTLEKDVTVNGFVIGHIQYLGVVKYTIQTKWDVMVNVDSKRVFKFQPNRPATTIGKFNDNK